MAVTLDMTDDYQIFDNTESVKVTLRNDSALEVTVGNALKRQIRAREQNAYGALLTNSSVIWEIPQAQLGTGKKVSEGDYIDGIDNVAEKWTVVRVDHCNSGTRWRCYCNDRR